MTYAKMQPHDPDGRLHVLEIGRVSTPHQDKKNIDASFAGLDRIAELLFEGPKDYIRLGEQASGMKLDRKTIRQAEDLIEDGWPDVVLMEDVSRSHRNPKSIYGFVYDCKDAGIRVIAPGDSLDTFDENWEVALSTAALRHGMHVPDTRRRVRRTADYAFEQGGMVLKVRFGYRKLTKEEAASGQFGPKGLRKAKRPEDAPVIENLRTMVVKQRQGGAALVRWLEDNRIAPGPYVTSGRWTEPVVLGLLRDPILYGLRGFRREIHEPLFSGRGGHRRRRNPSPLEKPWPELAFMTEAQWLEMNAVLDELAPDGDRPSGAQHPRHGVPTSRSISPLQHGRCVLCGSFYYNCGAGVAKCASALGHGEQECWNHVQINLGLVREKLVDLVLAATDAHPLARQVIVENAWAEFQRARDRGSNELRQVDEQIAELTKQSENLAKAIAAGISLDSVVQQSKDLKRQLREAARRRDELLQGQADDGMPKSIEALAVDPRPALLDLAAHSFDFSELLRRIIPRLVIYPVQALDSDQVRPRAALTLDLGVLLPAEVKPEDRPEPRHIVIDLFEPPEHIRHIERVVKARQERLQSGQKASLKVLAADLGIGRMTVKRALGYQRLMEAEGLSEPYRVLMEPPKRASRWKPRRPPDRSAAA